MITIFLKGKIYTINQRDTDHKYARARKVKAIRTQAMLLWKQALKEQALPLPLPCPVAVTALPRVVRQVDADACLPSVKACLDGLVDSRGLPDDGPAYVSKIVLLACLKVPAGSEGLEVSVALGA